MAPLMSFRDSEKVGEQEESTAARVNEEDEECYIAKSQVASARFHHQNNKNSHSQFEAVDLSTPSQANNKLNGCQVKNNFVSGPGGPEEDCSMTKI